MRLVLALMVLLLGPVTAEAHALLDSAVPKVGSSGPSPEAIRLSFTQEVEPLFCEVSITDAGGDPVELPKPAVDPKDATVLVVPLAKPLRPGAYRLEWHVLSVDTHRTEGHFRFTVTP